MLAKCWQCMGPIPLLGYINYCKPNRPACNFDLPQPGQVNVVAIVSERRGTRDGMGKGWGEREFEKITSDYMQACGTTFGGFPSNQRKVGESLYNCVCVCVCAFVSSRELAKVAKTFQTCLNMFGFPMYTCLCVFHEAYLRYLVSYHPRRHHQLTEHTTKPPIWCTGQRPNLFRRIVGAHSVCAHKCRCLPRTHLSPAVVNDGESYNDLFTLPQETNHGGGGGGGGWLR